MLTSLILFWLSIKLDAPQWVFICIIVSIILKIIKAGIGIYKAGQNN